MPNAVEPTQGNRFSPPIEIIAGGFTVYRNRFEDISNLFIPWSVLTPVAISFYSKFIPLT